MTGEEGAMTEDGFWETYEDLLTVIREDAVVREAIRAANPLEFPRLTAALAEAEAR
jgi:hypothetical protein